VGRQRGYSVGGQAIFSPLVELGAIDAPVIHTYLMDRPGPLAQAMTTYIIPAHNEELLIGRTISALQTAAGAVNEAYEIIVVDDASTDSTTTVAERSGARVVAVNYRQISAARNAGAGKHKAICWTLGLQVLEKNGGDDGTRTRGLCRDRVAGRRNLLELNGTDSPFLIL
jgi:hypothetical protein